MTGWPLTDEQRARLVAQREMRQAQAVAMVDVLPLEHILAERILAALGEYVTRTVAEGWPPELNTLEVLDIDARIVTELRRRGALTSPEYRAGGSGGAG